MKLQPKEPVLVPLHIPIQRFVMAWCLACLCAALASTAGCGDRGGRAGKAAAGDGDPALPLQTFARQWATDLAFRGDALEALHVRDDAVYAYTGGGRVVSLARDSGSIQFSRPIKGGRTALYPPVVFDEKIDLYTARDRTTAIPVVFPTATTLEMYEKGTGRYLTTAELGFTLRSDAVGKAGLLYVGGAYRGGSRAAALDIRQPYVPVQWELMTPGGAISAAPALVEDAVYFGGEDGSVYAVSAAGRQSIWPTPGGVFRTGGPIVGDLAADRDNVYVASTDNKLYALNRNNGKLRWHYFGSGALRTGPAVTSDTVYQFVPGTGLVALDKAAGDFIRKPRWVAPDATQFLAQDDRNAYVRTKNRRIVARDKQTGEVRFTSQHDDLRVFGTNLKEDGIIYAGTRRGRVIAVRPVLKPGTVGEIVMVETDE